MKGLCQIAVSNSFTIDSPSICGRFPVLTSNWMVFVHLTHWAFIPWCVVALRLAKRSFLKELCFLWLANQPPVMYHPPEIRVQ